MYLDKSITMMDSSNKYDKLINKLSIVLHIKKQII